MQRKSRWRIQRCALPQHWKKEYEHEGVKLNETTQVEGTNDKTAHTTESFYEPLLAATVSGIQAEIPCETEKSTGSIKNETTETAEKVKYMRVKGEEGVITFAGCVTKGTLAELGCTVAGEEIKTNELTAETKSDSMQVEIKPPQQRPNRSDPGVPRKRPPLARRASQLLELCLAAIRFRGPRRRWRP